ncbi:hypothetical protein B0H67DRAFT_499314 [Lasiosphaeris hirsuta]|uniref:Uncharacterized protein n=1 Tax=Lasiosphaeris hirsuta TaxID=260670 RepID=A0AA39ZVN1_9PEZI|nr:hypothetical protein B0H67DRAFT_499314 [Lasiosphaeris hirsuta]
MEKCWFALAQTHYPPPSPESMHRGAPDAPLALGHLVPNLRHLDQVINASAVEPFPRAMYIHGPFRMADFAWKDDQNTDVSVLARAGAPLLGMVPGVEASGTLGGLFRRRVERWWEFEGLEMYTVNPTRAYIDRVLAGEEVKKYIERVKVLGGWTVFMVTGLAVARGKTRFGVTVERGTGGVGGVGVGVPGVVNVEPEVDVMTTSATRSRGTHLNDFVWAIKVAKIHVKHGLQKNWTIATLTGKDSWINQRAIMSCESEKKESPDSEAAVAAVAEVIKAHGLDDFEVLGDSSLASGAIFVSPSIQE